MNMTIHPKADPVLVKHDRTMPILFLLGEPVAHLFADISGATLLLRLDHDPPVGVIGDPAVGEAHDSFHDGVSEARR